MTRDTSPEIRHPAPVFIDLPNDLGVHSAPTVDIWYLSCQLTSGQRHFNTQTLVVTNVAHPVSTQVYLVESGGPAVRHAVGNFAETEGALDADRLAIKLPSVTLQGDESRMELQAVAEDARLNLLLTRNAPILYANGTGLFPYHGGGTYQLSMVDLTASGTLTLEGESLDVTGSCWFDRQWAANAEAFATGGSFLWMGLSLDNGDNLSLWDQVAPDGRAYCWATVARPDGTHLITPVNLDAAPGGTDSRGPWKLILAGIGIELTVTQEAIHDAGGFYSGACTVRGQSPTAVISGYGFVDISGR